MRATVHYLFAVITLSIYGGQVCPFIDSLSMVRWTSEVTLLFGAAYFLRPLLWERYIRPVAPESRLPRALRLEWSLFVAVAGIITLYNMAVYDFPIGSGMKIMIACVGLGMFAALDLELAEERRLYEELAHTGRSLAPSTRYMPLTSRFTVEAIVVVTVATVAVILVVIRDMEWLGSLTPEQAAASRWIVAGEIAFVAGVALAHMINLTLSVGRNLKLFFGVENRVLAAATGGDLDSRVTVVRNNEFGQMGRYTNQMIESLKTRTDELMRTRDVTIFALASLAETRDNETGDHIKRTQRYVKALAERLRQREGYARLLDDVTIDLLYKSAPLHDIGKVGIPDDILLKPGKLTDGEFAVMKLHTTLGMEALDRADTGDGSGAFLRLAKEIAVGHHEKWDGSGYPHGLAGTAIPLSARLMAVADVYDALISKRVYKPAFSHDKAMGIIREGKGSHFDPTLIEVLDEVEEQFVDIARRYGEQAEAD